MNNEPVAWWTGKFEDEGEDFMFPDTRQYHIDHPQSETHKYFSIPLYTHPVKEQSTNERIEMLKEMVEKSANPVGWIGYHEGHLVSFLQTQEQVNSFLKNTDTAGRVKPVYTHPVKEQLTDEEIIKNFIDKQTQLPQEFQKVLYDNLWNLYES